MKKIITVLSLLFALTLCTSCAKKETIAEPEFELDTAKMKTICELATEECHYHSVVDYTDAGGMKNEGLFQNVGIINAIAKLDDKHFWLEYDGIVTMGIDMEKMSFQLDGDNVKISLPMAKIISSKVDASSINKGSYVVEKSLAKIKAEDVTDAVAKAQEDLEKLVAQDSGINDRTVQRAKQLLKNYIDGISGITGRTYNITWIETQND